MHRDSLETILARWASVPPDPTELGGDRMLRSLAGKLAAASTDGSGRLLNVVLTLPEVELLWVYCSQTAARHLVTQDEAEAGVWFALTNQLRATWMERA